MSEEIATILERAADRLSKPGAWTQVIHAGEACPDGTCAALAIADEADGNHRLEFSALRTLAEFLNLEFAAPPVVWEWNDAPGRTQEEVVQTLREAAAKARAAQ